MRDKPRSAPADDEITKSIQAAADKHRRAVQIASAARPAEAIKLLREALRVLPIASGQPEAITVRTKILVSLGYVQAETESAAEGLVHLGTASDLVNNLPGGRQRLQLLGLIGKQHALILLRAGRTAESLELFDQTIPLLEEAEDDAALVSPLMNRGLAYIMLGRPGPAEQDMRRCISLTTALGQPVLGAKARANLGDIALLVGDVPGALAHYESAERVFRQLAPDLVARTQIDQARALLTAGLAEDAGRHLDAALPELTKLRIGQDLAEAEVARAGAALLQGDLEHAAHMAGAARRHFLKRGNESWAEVAALTKLRAEANGVFVGRRSNVATVAKAAALAGRLSEAGLPDEAALARLLAVRLALRGGATGTAAQHLAQVSPPRKLAPIDHKILLRLCRAEVALAAGDTRRALAQAKQGFVELGAARDKMGGLDLVCGTAIHGHELGMLAVRLVLDSASTQADARRVLAWQERTRAQIYRYEPLPVIDDPELASRVTELRTTMRMVQQAKLDRRPATQLERRTTELQREVSRLGWHTSRWGRPRPVSSPDEIVERLGDRALISFVGPADELAAVVVAGGRTRLVRLGRKENVLETARQLHADLDALAPDDLIAPLVSVVSQSAKRRIAALDELLFGPDGIAPDLIGDRELVVVPFGGLYSVPWETLPALRGRAVSVAPSATAWVNAAESTHTDGSVVLVSGPNLPDRVSELDQLRNVYPDAVVLQGERATSSAVLSAMDGAKLVHIAAHGTHEPANAMFSRLELADGGLLAHEVARLQHPPEHIVLAACELALSHIRPGDEPLGFAGAMLASGSRTVVAAVNRVGHRSAAVTMEDYHRRLSTPEAPPVRPAVVDLNDTMADFHRRLASGTSPARALAEATADDPLRRPFICLGAG